MDIRTPLGQSTLLLMLSCIVGFGSNLVRTEKSIPWIAEKLTVVESVDTESDAPILAAISIDQAKAFFDDGVLFVDARDEGSVSYTHLRAHET